MENTPVQLYFEHYIPSKCDPDLHPIIFVHGLGDSSKTWGKVMERIADGTKREAYAIDLRNHGKSEWTDSMSHDSIILDIEHFMAQNGIKKSVFVTHSVGARVCMTMALRKPELVEKIVAEDARLDNATPEEVDIVLTLVKSLRAIRFLPKTMSEKEIRTLIANRAKQLFPGHPDIETAFYCIPWHKDSNGTVRLTFNLDAMERGFRDRSLLNIDLTACRKYDGQALILYGDKSVMAVGKDKVIPQYIPNAEFYRFEKGGHNIHIESEEEFVAKVRDFINT